MPFTFDIADSDGVVNSRPAGLDSYEAESLHVAVPPRILDLEELLQSLPDQLAYQAVSISNPADVSRQTTVLRRPLWDARMQIMAESSADSKTEDDALLAASDITANVYEGGLKTWEGSIDLARYLLARPQDLSSIMELGCGTAMPSLILLSQWLQDKPDTNLCFVLADFNATVLKLATLPNLILTWALHTNPEAFYAECLPEYDAETGQVLNEQGQLLLTEELLYNFRRFLTEHLDLTLIAGSWGSDFIRLVSQKTSKASVVLAAETIYSEAATVAIVVMLRALLSSGIPEAIVAAKTVYFGVGGSVDHFRELASEAKLGIKEQVGANTGNIDEGWGPELKGEGGVGRCILSVTSG